MSQATAQLRHVVLFKFKDSADPTAVGAIEAGFRQLAATLDIVRGFEWGINNSPEGLNQGFTHCFLLTFASAADRDAYLPHPEHQKFVAQLLPQLEKALVIDYWAQS